VQWNGGHTDWPQATAQPFLQVPQQQLYYHESNAFQPQAAGYGQYSLQYSSNMGPGAVDRNLAVTDPWQVITPPALPPAGFLPKFD
jgi:hypothetical protein